MAGLAQRLFSAGFGRVDVALGLKTFRSCAALLVTKVFRTSIITLDVILLGLMTSVREVGLSSPRSLFVGIPLGAAIYSISLAALGGIPEDVRDSASRLFAPLTIAAR